MSSYKFIEREIVTPLSNDMFITGSDLAAMLHKLEQSSELERFSKGSQVGFATMWGLSDVTTLEDTSQLDMDEVLGTGWEDTPYFMNPWLYLDEDEMEMERRQFSGEIVVERFLEEMQGNRFRVSFTYLMLDISRYNGLDLKEYYNFYFKLNSAPTLNYPKRGVYD